MAKIIQISQKRFVSFKMTANQTQGSKRFVTKFLLAEKCKVCEIYRRMWHMYEETCSSQKDVYKRAKCGFVITSLSQKGN